MDIEDPLVAEAIAIKWALELAELKFSQCHSGK